jgi:hypothetical protein
VAHPKTYRPVAIPILSSPLACGPSRGHRAVHPWGFYRGVGATAERAPSACSRRGRQSCVDGSVTGDQRRTRAVNRCGPSSTPELFAYAKLGPVTAASIAVEVISVSVCRGVSECWEHGSSPSCLPQVAQLSFSGRRTAFAVTEVSEVERWWGEGLHRELLRSGSGGGFGIAVRRCGLRRRGGFGPVAGLSGWVRDLACNECRPATLSPAGRTVRGS